MEVNKWARHFRLMAEGKLHPNHKGHWIVEQIQEGGQSREPEIKYVTPIARDIELAKSELEQNNHSSGTITKRSNISKKRRKDNFVKPVDKRRKIHSMRPPGMPAY